MLNPKNRFAILDINNNIDHLKYVSEINNSSIQKQVAKKEKDILEQRKQIYHNIHWKNDPNNPTKNMFILNNIITDGQKPDINPEDFQKYLNFLEFCEKATTDFYMTDDTVKQKSYYLL